MRLFIAIELPHNVRTELAGVLSELRQRSSGGRFVPLENMHITMHFIGENEDIVGAVAAMEYACRDFRPFPLHLGRYGFFDRSGGRGDGGKTSFVDVRGETQELQALHESLESALADRGFSREYKRFTPHITLGRNVEHDALVAQELKNIVLDASMQAQGLTLFESKRVRERMVYSVLHREKF